jgi:hypothetical protein
MNDMHPVMVLAAFAVAALVTYALVLAAISATSALSHERRDDVADDPRGGPATDVPATDRRPRAHC